MQKSSQRVRCDEPAVQQRGDAHTEPTLAELRKHERHVVVLPRHAAADTQRLVQRFGNQTRDVGVRGKIESRIHVRFERELT